MGKDARRNRQLSKIQDFVPDYAGGIRRRGDDEADLYAAPLVEYAGLDDGDALRFGDVGGLGDDAEAFFFDLDQALGDDRGGQRLPAAFAPAGIGHEGDGAASHERFAAVGRDEEEGTDDAELAGEGGLAGDGVLVGRRLEDGGYRLEHVDVVRHVEVPVEFGFRGALAEREHGHGVIDAHQCHRHVVALAAPLLQLEGTFPPASKLAEAFVALDVDFAWPGDDGLRQVFIEELEPVDVQRVSEKKK